ncbi:glycosyltransferase family 9 protein [Halorhodospira halochloris]|uniref:ADP-heptose--lipooligosaccharide heptosyltransferase II n=1 Tax=Halorhodospira halochloris TaxID=1052 RepID=A0A0X8XBJ1_HALHR|nr:glycosyltransferase family 9 protein [Halorhodospira halochloris]MBK1650640.1 glycosyl transferase [Halorhodospira halochloris]MCG5529748.1 glycosyltransferase family 9 protein [Halorhodospira halochloris]BAU56874.1 ADP-heptose--lipooligosaccharide heptosyltransferase II [Halorhodospira halochloris]
MKTTQHQHGNDSALNRLCLLRLSAIGDVTHVVPIVRTLQRYLPQCSLTWVIGKTEASLVGDIEGVEFIVVDKGDGLFGAAKGLKKSLAKRHFDVLLNMQASWRANILASVVNAPRKIGFDRQRARNGQQLFSNESVRGPQRVHVLDGFFQFVEALGIYERELRWDIPVSAAVQERVTGWLPAASPFLVISPCSSQRTRNFRNWSAQNYAAVAEYAYAEHGLELVLTGGQSALERDYAEAIRGSLASPVIDLVGKTSLKELYALLQRATLFIGPDSGPLHMANAAGAGVIGLYATSNPQRTGPYLHLDRVANRYPEAASEELGCSPEQLRWGVRVRSPDAMQRISVAEVCARIDELLGTRDKA